MKSDVKKKMTILHPREETPKSREIMRNKKIKKKITNQVKALLLGDTGRVHMIILLAAGCKGEVGRNLSSAAFRSSLTAKFFQPGTSIMRV